MDALTQIEQEGAALASSAAAPGGAGPAAAPAAAGGASSSSVAPEIAAAEALKREAEEWAGVPFVAGSILSTAFPELARVYTTEACRAWGEKMVPVARRYGWTIGDAGMWLGLAGATWGLVKPTADAIRRKIAEARAAQPAPAPAGAAQAEPAPPVPGTGTEPHGGAQGTQGGPGRG